MIRTDDIADSDVFYEIISYHKKHKGDKKWCSRDYHLNLADAQTAYDLINSSKDFTAELIEHHITHNIISPRCDKNTKKMPYKMHSSINIKTMLSNVIEQINNNIIKNFDFDSVHRYMLKNDHKWYDCKKGYHIPTIGELKDAARELLIYSYRNHDTIITGGFIATYKENERTGDIQMNLEFEGK